MAKKVELYYGEPGSGKSRALLELIKKYRDMGLKTRVYIGDGSAIMYSLSGLVDDGTVEMMDFSIRDSPFMTCQQITEGWWPVDVFDPQSKMRRLTPQEVKETGLWIFEGASVMGQYMMGDAKGGLAQRAADGEVLGQEANIKFKDGEGYNYGGNSGAHYNIAQRHLHADIMRSKALPGEMVIWTAHERVDDGERGGAFVKGGGSEKVKVSEKMIGPELVGKALTLNISREFGNTLHFVTATKRQAEGTDPVSGKTLYKDKTEYRIYTRDHYDPDGIVNLKYRAVCRCSGDPSKVKDYYTGEKPGGAILDFYRDLEEANKQ